MYNPEIKEKDTKFRGIRLPSVVYMYEVQINFDDLNLWVFLGWVKTANDLPFNITIIHLLKATSTRKSLKYD